MAFSFFNKRSKILKVAVDGHPSQEIKFSDRDPIDKVIDKIKTKFELTDEETQGFNIQVSLRGVWASPGQTIGDLLLRNNDQISFQRQPPIQQQPQRPQNPQLQTVPRQLYPSEDWVILNDNNGGGLRHSLSDGSLHQNHVRAADLRAEFLSKKTYVPTGKATLKFPSYIDPSVLQIPPELSNIATKQIPQPSMCKLEYEVLGKGYKEFSDFEKEEMECTRYLALKQKIRRDLQDETERARREAEQHKKERDEQEIRNKQEIEDLAIASAPNQERNQIMSDPHLKQCYLDLHLGERKLSAEVAARAACKFGLKEANRTVFLHLVTMQIPTNVSEAVAEDKTDLEEALNVAFSLCPLVEQYPDFSVQEIQKIQNAHLSVSAIDFHTFLGNYKQMKGMGFTCDHILVAIVAHPQDTSAALELLLSSQ